MAEDASIDIDQLVRDVAKELGWTEKQVRECKVSELIKITRNIKNAEHR